uniref:Uncharacterized protein n=1 Tax=viral metagenome TaxID=1070528 RepID=A0A6C0LEI0_9ZZZZ
MSTTARYIASIRSKVIAKSTKIQYKNHIVTTNNLYNGIIPCPAINPQQIAFSDKELSCCKPSPQIQIRYLIYDGGTPYASGPKIYDGGLIFRVFDGGSPYTNYSNVYDGLTIEHIYDGGGIEGITGNSFDGNYPFIFSYDGGNVSGSLHTFDGGTASSGGSRVYNSLPPSVPNYYTNPPSIFNFDGGDVLGSQLHTFDGGTASSGGSRVYNSINVLSPITTTTLSGLGPSVRRITLDGGNNTFY